MKNQCTDDGYPLIAKMSVDTGETDKIFKPSSFPQMNAYPVFNKDFLACKLSSRDVDGSLVQKRWEILDKNLNQSFVVDLEKQSFLKSQIQYFANDVFLLRQPREDGKSFSTSMYVLSAYRQPSLADLVRKIISTVINRIP